jgi:uncharacterized membrane protein
MNARIQRMDKSCQICGATQGSHLRRGVLVSPPVAEFIHKEFPDWSESGWICNDDLQRFRSQYIQSLLTTEKRELTLLEEEVLESLKQQEIFAHNPNKEIETDLSFGQKLADRIAVFGGSWRFILLFGMIIWLWISLNTIAVFAFHFDPYPFILLNLILSCIAAIQAPVIMMSQNRQESRDRIRAEHDYQVNLKAELEIRHLHQKIDHLLSHQWERMVEIQEIQMEVLTELRKKKE